MRDRPRMKSLEELLARLHAADPELTPDEIRDALWLAPYLPAGAHVREASAALTEARRGGPDRAAIPHSPSEQMPARTAAESPAPSGTFDTSDVSEEIPLYPATQAGTYADEVEGRRVVLATRVRTPRARALPNARALSRALRPLMRRIPSRTELILDEEATAERLAEEIVERHALGSMVSALVLRPAPHRWLDIALVVDTCNSMILWQDTAREFRDLLAGQGAFSDVRLWWLDTQSANAPSLYPETNAGGRMTPRPRPPQEIIRPRGDRLILVLTDCVAPAWQDGQVMDLLAQWGAQDSVAVLQMLPETMWNRTVMDPGELLVSAHVAGLPNTGLVAEAHPDIPPYIAAEMLRERKRRGAVAIPVITLDPRALGGYARLVVGLGRARVPAVDITVPSRPEPPPEAHILERQREEPLALVARFRATTDPITQQLAGYVALLPLNLSIMQMVHTVLLPASRLAHLAEFLTSGLVYRDTEAEKAAGEPVFDFVQGVRSVGGRSEGVRELLQRTVRESDTLWVFRKVAEFLGEEAGLGQGFSALAPHELGSEMLVLNARTLPFARLQTEVLERMGMRADAERMRERIESQKPPAITLLREMPAQPDVYFRPAWSPDGRLFATPTRDGRVLLWDPLQTRDVPVRILEASRFGVNQVSWSHDGKFLAAASFDHIVRVWEYPQETPLMELKLHRSDVRTVSYVPTTAGQELATGTQGGTIRTWDPFSQKIRHRFHLHRGAVNILQWSPSGWWLAFGCDDGTVGIYHWELSEPLLYQEQETSIRSLCWELRNRRLLAGSRGGEITSWTVVGGALHLDRRVNAHQGVVNSLSLSHDGRVLASKSADSTVRFWRADTLEYLDGFDEPSSGFTYSAWPFIRLSPSWRRPVRRIAPSASGRLIWTFC